LAGERYRTRSVALLVRLVDGVGEVVAGEAARPRLLLAVPHIYWDPKLPEVKSAQARLLRTRLAAFNSRGDVAIAAGDFNSMPDSEVYAVMRGGTAAAVAAAATGVAAEGSATKGGDCDGDAGSCAAAAAGSGGGVWGECTAAAAAAGGARGEANRMRSAYEAVGG
jgi:Endonuclease/Exonuclease/phosphatase family